MFAHFATYHMPRSALDLTSALGHLGKDRKSIQNNDLEQIGARLIWGKRIVELEKEFSFVYI